MILPSNMAGKLAVSFVALTLVLSMVHYRVFAFLLEISLDISFVLLVLSFSIYIKRFIDVLSTEKNKLSS